jgi:hypothetical protein
VVALWFWAPLVWGWVAPKDTGGAAAPTATVAQEPGGPRFPSMPSAGMPTPAAHVEPTAQTYPWQQVAQWMKHDARTKPVGPLLAHRGPATAMLSGWLPWRRLETQVSDPFFHPVPVETLADRSQQHAVVELPSTPVSVSPQDVGASVTGVIAGRAGGTVMINGRAYLLGDQVHLHKDGMSYAFQVAEILPAKVVLTREGLRYELSIPFSAGVPRPTTASTTAGTGETDSSR